MKQLNETDAWDFVRFHFGHMSNLNLLGKIFAAPLILATGIVWLVIELIFMKD